MTEPMMTVELMVHIENQPTVTTRLVRRIHECTWDGCPEQQTTVAGILDEAVDVVRRGVGIPVAGEEA